MTELTRKSIRLPWIGGSSGGYRCVVLDHKLMLVVIGR